MWRVGFWVWAVVLFVLTHWPRLKPPGLRVERPDLVGHFGGFGLWYVLLHGAGYFGDEARRADRDMAVGVDLARSGRWAAVWKPWVTTAAYAAVDEGLQLIPAVHRHAAWSDYAANVAGATMGMAGVIVWRVWMGRWGPQQSG